MARRPFDGQVIITTEYGQSQPGTRRGYHTGVDYAVNTGTPVLAPESGTIEQNGDGRAESDGRGFFVLVRGDSGVMHCLYHLKQMGNVSGRVGEGQVVGYSGSTGRSTGPHLHWETRKAPFDGNSDFAPGTWLFKDQPVYVPPVNVTKSYIRIFGDYRSVWSSSAGTNKKGTIAPNNQPSRYLDYEVLDRSGNYTKIRTRDFGEGWVLSNGPLVDSLTQFYNA